MNETSLSITQTLIERTLVENLRLEAVHYGYMPDITKFSRTTSGYEAYKAAQRRVADEKGFCIDVLNNLAPVEMGEKKFARMVVENSTMYTWRVWTMGKNTVHIGYRW